jgi:hypothetical protein
MQHQELKQLNGFVASVPVRNHVEAGTVPLLIGCGIEDLFEIIWVGFLEKVSHFDDVTSGTQMSQIEWLDSQVVAGLMVSFARELNAPEREFWQKGLGVSGGKHFSRFREGLTRLVWIASQF